ncbi:MAG TPA: cyclic nucleotide-binding domain-containing protein [Candidatus Binatia bacterium]|nr:cyclic nucleotide-binding domain-containing protein [Candidatus Binatia bacterium]
MGITIVQARSDAEREKIFQFRYHVYVEELRLSPPAVDHGRKRLWDPLDDVSVSHVIFDDGEVMGSLRVTFLDEVPDPSPLIEKFALEPAVAAFGQSAICMTSRFILHPRLRHGTAIFRLMEAAFAHGMARRSYTRFNYGDCSPHLLPFYEHMGYRRYTRAYNDTAYGFKIPILMLVRDRQRFERVRSPLLRVAARHADDPEARTWFERTYPEYLTLESAPFLPEGVFLDLLCARVAADPLHSRGLLHDLDRAEAEQFLARATIIKAEPGDRIVRQGEPGDTVFVLLSGIAEVTLDESPHHPAAILGAGDTFGEISFLTAKPRIANVTAKAPCELIVLSGESLNRIIAKEPTIAAKVLLNLSRMLAERLAVTTSQALHSR